MKIEKREEMEGERNRKEVKKRDEEGEDRGGKEREKR